MDKNDIIDYVTETPGNTNRAILGSMLDSFASSGGGGGSASNFVVTFNGDRQSGSWTSDKTFADVKSAYDNGQNIVGKYTKGVITFYMPLMAYVNNETDEYSFFSFALVQPNSSAGEITGLINHQFMLSSADTVMDLWADVSF